MWAHLENAGGSYVPKQVTDALTNFYTRTKVQPYWDFGPSASAGSAMDRSYELLAASVNAESSHGIALGPSTTQNTYVLAQALRPGFDEGAEIIVTDQDHEANIGAWRRMADSGLQVREWQVDRETGVLHLADLEALVTDRTALVAVTHASNVAATINPIAAIGEITKSVGALLVVDGVSHAPHAALDLPALGCDFYVYSLYKTYGPHLGLIWWAPEHADRLANQGHYFNEASVPKRLTPAGPDHAAVACAGGIVDYYDAVLAHHDGDMEASVHERTAAVYALFSAHEEMLMKPLLDFLVSRDDVRIVGATEADHLVREPTIAFYSEQKSSAEIYRALIDGHVSCGHGNFYARRLIEALGLDPTDGVVRLSMVHYNTAAEVERAISVLDGAL